MLTAANFGISMIVAPAYILSLKTGFLTFGQAEYVLQAGLFIVFCLVMRKFKAVYLSSFVTCLIYGAVLDLWAAAADLQPERDRTRQYAYAAPRRHVCIWNSPYFALDRLLFQDLSLSAGV